MELSSPGSGRLRLDPRCSERVDLDRRRRRARASTALWATLVELGWPALTIAEATVASASASSSRDPRQGRSGRVIARTPARHGDAVRARSREAGTGATGPVPGPGPPAAHRLGRDRRARAFDPADVDEADLRRCRRHALGHRKRVSRVTRSRARGRRPRRPTRHEAWAVVIPVAARRRGARLRRQRRSYT
jgi:hypothetical protein